MEEWKDIPGYEGKYKISNKGRVKTLNYLGSKGNTKILKPGINGKGYYTIMLSNKQRKKHYIHQLVMLVFKGYTTKKGFHIDHIDSDPSNNTISNLRVLTHRENTNKEIKEKKELPIGVTKTNKRYRAKIRLGGKNLHLGYFATPEEAGKAYQKALEQYGKE